ncbi:hypothetical protein EIM46_21575, partial [Xanthomonas vasicola pv. musacearum]
GVIDASACSGEGAAAPISCLSWTANWHISRIAWRWSASACARPSIVGHRRSPACPPSSMNAAASTHSCIPTRPRLSAYSVSSFLPRARSSGVSECSVWDRHSTWTWITCFNASATSSWLRLSISSSSISPSSTWSRPQSLASSASRFSCILKSIARTVCIRS